MLSRNPTSVSTIPFCFGWVLMKRNMKIGAITMAAGTVGKSSLRLVSVYTPIPSKDHKVDSNPCSVAWRLLFVRRWLSRV